MNSKNRYMLEDGSLNMKGYDWWWHSFTGYDQETHEERTFFIEYYVINPGLGGPEPIFGQLASGEGKAKPSYAMIKAGSWGKGKKQIHNMYGIDSFSFRHDPFRVQIGNNIMENYFISGIVNLSDEEAMNHPEYMSDSGKMSWNLMIYKDQSYDVGYGTSQKIRDKDPFNMYWHVEGLKTKYDGYVDFDGRRYIVSKDTSYGYQDKNWGSDYTNPWVWLNCCNLKYKGTDQVLEDTCFDFGGGNPLVKGKAMPGKILGVFVHEGKVYEYNFSKVWKKNKQMFTCREDAAYVYWQIKCQNHNSRVAVSFKAKKEDMLLINYENPEGLKLHNQLLNGGTAFGQVRLYDKVGSGYELVAEFEGSQGGCEYGEY